MDMGFSKGGDWLLDQYEKDGPAKRPWGQVVVDMTLARLMVREAAIREALGRWTSELEPVLAFDHEGRFAGLTYGPVIGEPINIIVPIKGDVTI